MAEKYEEKKVYYIPAFVERIENLGNYPVKVSFRIGEERCAVQFEDLPDLMFTEEEVIGKASPETEELNKKIAVLKCDINRRDTTIIDRNAQISALEARLSESETLLKEVMATRDEAVKQNNELIAGCKDWKKAADETLAEYKELKAERDSARKQADIFQEEIKKLTAERDKFAKTAKDKADIAREAIDHLQEENKKLKQELKDAETAYTVVADTSLERKNRVTTMEEVIDALVEKIRRLKGED